MIAQPILYSLTIFIMVFLILVKASRTHIM